MANKKFEEDDEIDLKEAFKVFLKYKKGFFAIVAVCTLLGVIYNFIKAPVYQSNATMAIMYDGANNESSSAKYVFSEYLCETVVIFIAEDVVMDKVAADYQVTSKAIKQGLSVSGESLIINLSYSASSPEASQSILNKIMETAIGVANEKNVDGTPKYKILNDNLCILSYAKEGEKVSSLFKMFVLAIGAGVLLGAAYVFICNAKNNKFRTTDEIEKELGLVVISSIPYYDFNGGNKKNVKK